MNDLVYIGSAARSLNRRWIVHRSDLRRQKHHVPQLQAVFRKHGFSALVFEVLEFCEPSECIAIEQRYIGAHPRKKLYNLNPIAGSRLGTKLTEHQKRLLAEKKGGIGSPEVLLQIVREYEEGAKQIELAKKFNVDRASIRNYLRKAGGKIRPLPTRNLQLREKIVAKYLAGCPIKQLARDQKLDYDTVVRILQQSNIQLRNNSNRQKLRFLSIEARRLHTEAKGGKIYHFIHRLHGKFSGYPFELAEKFRLKSRGNIGQLIKGKRAAYCGWEIADSESAHKWRRPEEREFRRGERHPMFGKHHDEATRRLISEGQRKLTNEQIAEVRALLLRGVRQKELAERFGADQSVISRIKTRSRGYGTQQIKTLLEGKTI